MSFCRSVGIASPRKTRWDWLLPSITHFMGICHGRDDSSFRDDGAEPIRVAACPQLNNRAFSEREAFELHGLVAQYRDD